MPFAARVGWTVGIASLGHGVLVALYVWSIDTALGSEHSRASAWVVLLAYLVVSLVLGVAVSSLIRTPLARLIAELRILGREGSTDDAAFRARAGESEIAAELRSVVGDIVRVHRSEVAARDAITAGIAHDLKTPLIAARRALRAGIDAHDHDRLRHGAAAVIEELGRVADQVQKLIDVQRFGRSDAYVGKARIDLGDLVDQVVRSLAPVAEERYVRLSSVGASETLGDGQALRRAVENLVSNAIRHARSIVSIEVLQGLIRVSDDGPGLPEGFDPTVAAYRVGEASRWSPSGAAGLGWFVAAAILRAHGGRLVVERSGSAGTVVLMYVGMPSGRGGAPE